MIYFNIYKLYYKYSRVDAQFYNIIEGERE